MKLKGCGVSPRCSRRSVCAINYKRGSAVQIAEETQTAGLARSANLRREVQCECVFVRMQGCDMQMSPTTSKARASPSKAQKVSLNGHWDQFACASDKTLASRT